MMSQESDFKYAEVPELDATILQLFYEGNDVSMILVLPNEVDGITRSFKLTKGEDELAISGAIQKAFIEVNEDGAEAAAANVFAVGFTAGFIREQPKRFLADRPFYFEIRLNDLIIFNGVKAN
ncbi:unnamed protein product [Pieris brassicae]|uniref:Serpin domain-containing protein n=1 Tax=Pieris brassicae TaxID=7116 RepID=A0A9P0X6J9_PIEBR|nr:unnamed protein product [Pieris brassicae]